MVLWLGLGLGLVLRLGFELYQAAFLGGKCEEHACAASGHFVLL